MLRTGSYRHTFRLHTRYLQLELEKLVQVRVQEWPPVAHLLVEGSKCASHVRAHVTRGLIRDLDTGLQDGLWHNLGLQVSIAKFRQCQEPGNFKQVADMRQTDCLCMLLRGGKALYCQTQRTCCRIHKGEHLRCYACRVSGCSAASSDLRGSIDWLSREEASEVCMGSFCSNLQLALQVGDPALHEVHIV